MRSLTSLRKDRMMVVCVCLAALLAVTPFARAQPKSSTTSSSVSKPGVEPVRLQMNEKALQQVIAQLDRLNRKGETFDANAVRGFYSEQTKWVRMDEKEVDLHIAVASALEKSATSTGRSDLLEISDLAYKGIIKHTQGETRLRASSNFCAQQLRHDDPGKAVEIMKAVEASLDDESLGRSARSRSLYNYGRALQRSGDFKGAYEKLKKAAEVDPTFSKAAQAAGEVALSASHETTGIPLVVELTNDQLARFDYGGVSENLRKAMATKHWIGHPLYPRLLGQLVRYFTAARIEPMAFEQSWRGFLAAQQMDDYSKQIIDCIERIYAGRLRMAGVDPDVIRKLHSVWERTTDSRSREPDLSFLSSFIKMVGDHYYRQGDAEGLEKSLVCYSHAWGLDVKNMEAGLYLANVLLYDLKDEDRRLDREYRILDAFIDQLFIEKNRQYRLNLGKDWERIVKCHIILATIFEKRGLWVPAWKPEPTFDDPRTALFQWRLARDALEKLDESAAATKERWRPVVVKGFQEAEAHLSR